MPDIETVMRTAMPRYAVCVDRARGILGLDNLHGVELADAFGTVAIAAEVVGQFQVADLLRELSYKLRQVAAIIRYFEGKGEAA